MTSSKPGRQTKALDPAVVDRIIGAIAIGCTYEAAAAAGPISVRTFYDWMGRAEKDLLENFDDSPYRAFAARVEAANLEAELKITQAWVAAIPNDWRAARDFLERRFPSRWRRPEPRGDQGGYQVPTDFLSDEARLASLITGIERWRDARRALQRDTEAS